MLRPLGFPVGGIEKSLHLKILAIWVVMSLFYILVVNIGWLRYDESSAVSGIEIAALQDISRVGDKYEVTGDSAIIFVNFKNTVARNIEFEWAFPPYSHLFKLYWAGPAHPYHEDYSRWFTHTRSKREKIFDIGSAGPINAIRIQPIIPVGERFGIDGITVNARPRFIFRADIILFLLLAIILFHISFFRGGAASVDYGLPENVIGAKGILLVSCTLVLLFSVIPANIGIGTVDEGFLYYPSKRILHGEIPIKDMFSYNPGRYYWSAALFKLFGDGLLSQRYANSLFQLIAMAFGIAVFRKFVNSVPSLIAAGAFLALWMYPSYKVYDSGTIIIAIYFAVRILESPSAKNHFYGGLFVVAASFIGRHHGVFIGGGFLAMVVFMRIKTGPDARFKKNIGVLFFGMALGLIPWLLMFIFISDFFSNFIYSVEVVVKSGMVDHPLPVPWPWSLDYSGLNFSESLNRFFVGLYFVAVLVLYVAMAFMLFLAGRDKIETRKYLAIPVFLGLFYLLYIFKRSDLMHLAVGIHPLLFGMVALPHTLGVLRSKIPQFLLYVILTFSAVFASGLDQDYVKKLMADKYLYGEWDIGEDTLVIRKDRAGALYRLKKTIDEHVKPDEELLMIPHQVLEYAILDRRSPVWDTVFTFPQLEKKEREMIAQLEGRNVNWAIACDYMVDGNVDYHPAKTHPLFWAYLLENYEKIDQDGLDPSCELMSKKGN